MCAACDLLKLVTYVLVLYSFILVCFIFLLYGYWHIRQPLGPATVSIKGFECAQVFLNSTDYWHCDPDLVRGDQVTKPLVSLQLNADLVNQHLLGWVFQTVSGTRTDIICKVK